MIEKMGSILNITPSPTYEGLLKQFSAMKFLVNNQEKIMRKLQQKIEKLETENKIFSKEEFNSKLDLIEKLTNELEELYAKT